MIEQIVFHFRAPPHFLFKLMKRLRTVFQCDREGKGKHPMVTCFQDPCGVGIPFSFRMTPEDFIIVTFQSKHLLFTDILPAASDRP